MTSVLMSEISDFDVNYFYRFVFDFYTSFNFMRIHSLNKLMMIGNYF